MRRHCDVIDRGFVIAMLAKALQGGVDDLDLLLRTERKKFFQYAHILLITESVINCIIVRVTESVNMGSQYYRDL